MDWVAYGRGKGKVFSVDAMRMARVIGGSVQFQVPTALPPGWYSLVPIE